MHFFATLPILTTFGGKFVPFASRQMRGYLVDGSLETGIPPFSSDHSVEAPIASTQVSSVYKREVRRADDVGAKHQS
jgi:hypothetical protein